MRATSVVMQDLCLAKIAIIFKLKVMRSWLGEVCLLSLLDAFCRVSIMCCRHPEAFPSQEQPPKHLWNSEATPILQPGWNFGGAASLDLL